MCVGGGRLGKEMKDICDQLTNSKITEGINKGILDDFMRVMKKPNIYIWCNHKQIPMYLDYFVTKHGCNFDILIWNKTDVPPLYNGKYLTDKEYCLYFRKGGYCSPQNYNDAKTVFYQSKQVETKKVFGHPTIKPSNIIGTLIRNSSKVGDVVFDPFLGSGTTCKCAKDLNRQYLGFEINEKWYKVAVNRLNTLI